MQQHTVHFSKIRETKGAVLYVECDKDGKMIDAASHKIGNLYIKKATFNGKIADRISAQVSWND